MKKDRFRDRYIIKLVGSILIALLNVIIQLLLPRALTVEEYGYYSYNLNIFTSIVGLANLSANGAMVSKFAKRVNEIGIVLFYLKFYFVVAIILNIGVTATYKLSYFNSFYGGQTLLICLLGLEAAIVNRLIIDGVGVGDSMEISRFPMIVQVWMKVLAAFVIISGYFIGRFHLSFFYISQIVITGGAAFIILYGLLKDQSRQFPNRIDRGREYFKEYFDYCKPLFFSSTISQACVIFTNWALMHWSGVAEQALFGAAWQINSLVGYVFTTYCELQKREFAVSYQNMEELKIKYELSLRRMIWLTSYFALFIGVTSEWFLPIVFGSKYSGAADVTLLIMIYTIYQSWGQVSGSFFLALERTKIYAVLGIISAVFSMACVFTFQIPNPLFVESLGAFGIGLTYCVSNFFCVELNLYFNSKYLGMSFVKNSMIQLPAVFICSGVAVMLKQGIDFIFTDMSFWGCAVKFLASGLVYTAIIFCVIWVKPRAAGLTRESLLEFAIWKKHHKGKAD